MADIIISGTIEDGVIISSTVTREETTVSAEVVRGSITISAEVVRIGAPGPPGAGGHSHANLALLDTYTQTEVDLADAVAKKHSAGTDTGLDTGGANPVTAAAIVTHIADAGKHREINDAGSATTDLWSGSKITSELSGKAATSHTHTFSQITDFTTGVNNNGNVALNTVRRHTQGSDLALDTGNANEVTAADLRTHLDDATIHEKYDFATTFPGYEYTAGIDSIINAFQIEEATILDANKIFTYPTQMSGRVFIPATPTANRTHTLPYVFAYHDFEFLVKGVEDGGFSHTLSSSASFVNIRTGASSATLALTDEVLYRVWYNYANTTYYYDTSGEAEAGKAAANGFASLDSDTLIPQAQMPERAVTYILVAADTDISPGTNYDLQAPIPSILNGRNIINFTIHHDVVGAGDNTSAALYNLTDSTTITSSNNTVTAGSLNSGAATINTSFDDVATNDRLQVQLAAASFTTIPKGLSVTIYYK